MAINPLSNDNNQHSSSAKKVSKIAKKVAKRAIIPAISGCCCSIGSCLPVALILFVVILVVVFLEKIKEILP
ncbi:MAG: hypothetical protein V1902_00950 [Candidatus Falkowbacteria bacterium]